MLSTSVYNRVPACAETHGDLVQQGGYWLSSVIPSFVPGFVVRGFSKLYYSMITRPLEYFYFAGPVWQNIPPQEICNAMTENKLGSVFWLQHPEACLDMLHRGFVSWDTKVTTMLYFTVLGFTTVYLTMNCFFLPRILRSVCKRLYKKKRKRAAED